jgi:GMP synthase (glutamine-hydrolysing)
MKPILVILHQELSTPGRVGRLLVERGFPVDIRRPRFGDALPETLEEHSGAAIFGGPMSANDTEDYVRREIDWMEVPLKERAPFFGICLGAQFLARALGARVDFHPEGLIEAGYYPLRPTPTGAALMQWPDHVYHFHREGFDLPKGAELLATGEIFENQAFRYGETAFGVQFHPEVTHQMMCRWTTRGAHRLELPGARPRHEHFDGRPQHDPKVRGWLASFLDHWTGLMRRREQSASA